MLRYYFTNLSWHLQSERIILITMACILTCSGGLESYFKVMSPVYSAATQ